MFQLKFIIELSVLNSLQVIINVIGLIFIYRQIQKQTAAVNQSTISINDTRRKGVIELEKELVSSYQSLDEFLLGYTIRKNAQKLLLEEQDLIEFDPAILFLEQKLLSINNKEELLNELSVECESYKLKFIRRLKVYMHNCDSLAHYLLTTETTPKIQPSLAIGYILNCKNYFTKCLSFIDEEELAIYELSARDVEIIYPSVNELILEMEAIS